MTEFIILEPSPPLNLAELCASAGVTEALLQDLVAYGVLVPESEGDSREWLFQNEALAKVKKAERMRRDLALDWAGIALALELLEDIEKLSLENQQLKHRLDRFGLCQ